MRAAEQALACRDFRRDKRERAVADQLEISAHHLSNAGRAASRAALVNQRHTLAQRRVEYEFVRAGFDLFFDPVLETQRDAMSVRGGGRRRDGGGFSSHQSKI